MLQLYTAKDNRTGPQTIELLTRRIVNLGAVQAGQVRAFLLVNNPRISGFSLVNIFTSYLASHWLIIFYSSVSC